MAYRRSYDTDPKLSAVVQALENMNDNVQQQVIVKIRDISELLLAQLGGSHYIENIEPSKKEGLQKAKARKRWYDQEEAMHQAFINLYALDNATRRELAEQMTLPIAIVRGYEDHCLQLHKAPELKVVEEVLRTCFKEGKLRAKKLYALYLPEFSQEFQSHQNNRLKPEPKKGLWTLLLESLQQILQLA